MSVSFDVNFWTVLLFVMNFGLAAFVAISNRSKAAADELKAMKSELQKQIMAHGNRLERVEADIENAIGDDDMKAVHRRVDDILSSSKVMEGQLSMIITNLKDLHTIMLTGGMSR